MERQPTIFHITHQKAGSQWVKAVLKSCDSERFVPQKVAAAHYIKAPIKVGCIYPCIYLTKPNFEALLGSNLWLNYQRKELDLLGPPHIYLSNWFNFQQRNQKYLPFVVIRDLRDALVSAYFSFKISHRPPLTKDSCKWREKLNQLDKQQGLLYIMNENLDHWASIQTSWLNTEALVVKYEDLVADEYGVFEQIIDYCQINVKRQLLHEIIKSNSFEVMTGRQRGQENINAHQRKGVVGDWRNHFSEQVKGEFKQRFGEVLIKAGYEKNTNW